MYITSREKKSSVCLRIFYFGRTYNNSSKFLFSYNFKLIFTLFSVAIVVAVYVLIAIYTLNSIELHVITL